MQTITVPQVFKAMGVEPTNAQAWSAGARVATMYAEKHGQQPPKENRQKTSGSGSHCFAVYPRSWQARIKKVIAELVEFDRKQTALF